jgi:type I restriction enzyme S subunit
MIPEGWQVQNLADVALIILGQSPPSSACNENVQGYPFYQGNADFGYRHPLPQRWIENPLKVAKKDDILISVRAPVGELNIANTDCCIGRGVGAIRPLSANRNFIYYTLLNAQNSLASVSQGSTFDAINGKELRSLSLLIPPLSEQKKIAAILSSVDDAIQAKQAVIDQTSTVKQGLLQLLLTRGIGHINFEEKEINQFPKGWKWVNLGDVTNESKRRNDGSFSDNDLYAVTKINGLIPMRERVRGKNLDRCKVVLPTAFAYNPMRLNIGSIAQWGGDKPVIVSPDYVVFECDSSKIDSLYINYIRKSHAWAQFMDNAGKGSVRIRIYYKNLADFQFPLPPLIEQKQIVTNLKSFDKVLKVEQKKLDQTLIIKRGLMQDLLTGRVRVGGSV